MKKILFILTGGTIDSITKGQERDALLKNSAVPEYLKNLNLKKDFEFIQACMKDSRDVNEQDRGKILGIIENTEFEKVIITHGTFTMAESAKFLLKNLKRKNQTVIFTGSLTPLLGFKDSDAPFNLQYAIKQVRILPPGVYVCMNGQSFPGNLAVKNENTGEFYSQTE